MNKFKHCINWTVCFAFLLNMANVLYGQNSNTGTWTGISVLPVYENDPVGVPGELIISLSNTDGKMHGSIKGIGIFHGEELYNIKSTAKNFTASVDYWFATQTNTARIFLKRDSNWMFGIINLEMKIGSANHMKVYIRRQ